MTTAAQSPDKVHRYRPRGACAAVFRRRDDEVLISGPAGTGKSRACLEKVLAVMLANPGARALLVRKTLVSLSDSGLQTFRKYVAAEAIAEGLVTWYGGSRQEPAQFRFTNGSAVMVGGMDNPTKVMSTEYDVIYVQEATELALDEWQNLTTRLRNNRVSFQQLLADCNPESPFHWLYQRVQAGTTVMLESRHEDNPTLFDDDGEPTELGKGYIAKLDNLTGVKYQRLRLGKWVAAEGVIYSEFSQATHVVDPFPIPAEWPRWWSVDFGYVNPFVLQWWAEDPDGRLYLYREIYHTRRLVEDHVVQALRLCAPGWEPYEPDEAGNVRYRPPAPAEWTEPMPRSIICDHDAEDRATLERYAGQGTLPAEKTVLDGIQAVKQRLRVQGDGKPRLYIVRGARVEEDPELVDEGRPTSTEQELPAYVWKPAPHTSVVEKHAPDEPEKRNDHGADALRYVVMERELGAPTTRTL